MKRGFVALALLPMLSVGACQSGFTSAQRESLRGNGFQPNGEDWMLGISERLLFAFDSSGMAPAQAQHIRRMGSSLVAVGISGAEVRGHTDSLGGTAYNEVLSLRRADAVRQALVGGGMQAASIRVVGMGARDPIAGNDTEDGRRQNRRVVIVVSPRTRRLSRLDDGLKYGKFVKFREFPTQLNVKYNFLYKIGLRPVYRG